LSWSLPFKCSWRKKQTLHFCSLAFLATNFDQPILVLTSHKSGAPEFWFYFDFIILSAGFVGWIMDCGWGIGGGGLLAISWLVGFWCLIP
jgi:hypothetical protein